MQHLTCQFIYPVNSIIPPGGAFQWIGWVGEADKWGGIEWLVGYSTVKEGLFSIRLHGPAVRTYDFISLMM